MLTTSENEPPPTTPPGRGARLLLTRDLVDAIAAAVRLGAFLSAAVASQGFSRRAYQRWMRIGESAIRRKEDPKKRPAGRKYQRRRESDALYTYFVTEVRKAAACCRVESEIRLRELGENDAEVLFRFMAKRFPRPWGDPTKRTAEMPGGCGSTAFFGGENSGAILYLPKKVPIDAPTQSRYTGADAPHP